MVKNNKNFANIVFIAIFFLVIAFGELSLVRNEKDVLVDENRATQKFEHFTIGAYINGEYQKKLENALTDQFIGSGFIKTKVNDLTNFINYNKILKFVCKNNYVRLSGDFYNYNCDDYMVLKPNILTENAKNIIKNRLEDYSDLNNNIDTYYYFITTSRVYNFQTNSYEINMLDLIKKNLKGNYNIEMLKLNDYEDYTKYFYKTDHHWNYEGSYQGYIDIINMMKPNDEIKKPIKKITFDDINFYGSSARTSRIFDYKENFVVYQFQFPEFETIIDEVSYPYGNENKYFQGTYLKDRLANHYGTYYGGDYGEIIFNFNNEEKENILILGSSYTNAINKLIASHFNKTYVIDLRHYESVFNKKFDVKDYIEQNNIDKVLIIADYNYLVDQDFNMEWGE